MQYRRFGQTNLHLSVFSLGTMRGLSDRQAFESTVEQALASGINHIETAQGYGPSELWLGECLTQLSSLPRDLVITTKLPPTTDAATLERQIDASLNRLQRSRIDCLALHGVNTWEHLAWIQNPQGGMAAIRRAQADGRIGHLGFSSHGVREVIAATIETGEFAFVNLHYYYFFQRHHPILDLAQQQDMGIFIISPADKGGMLYQPPETLQRLCRPYHPLPLTYRWLLQDPRITTLSLGAATPHELLHPLSVADQTHPLTAAEQTSFERLVAHQNQALGPDQCRQCYACLPCPEAIQIPEILRLRNLAVAYNMQEFGEYRYRMFGNAGHWFPGRKGNHCTDCGDCLPKCPEQLNIPALLRDTHHRLNGPERRRLWG